MNFELTIYNVAVQYVSHYAMGTPPCWMSDLWINQICDIRILYNLVHLIDVLVIFTQPLRSGRIWHKINDLKRSLTGLNSEFSFS